MSDNMDEPFQREPTASEAARYAALGRLMYAKGQLEKAIASAKSINQWATQSACQRAADAILDAYQLAKEFQP